MRLSMTETRPPRRCVYCHADAESGLASCPGCKATLHEECRGEARSCGTIGCPYRPPVLGMDHLTSIILGSTRWRAVIEGAGRRGGSQWFLGSITRVHAAAPGRGAGWGRDAWLLLVSTSRGGPFVRAALAYGQDGSGGVSWTSYATLEAALADVEPWERERYEAFAEAAASVAPRQPEPARPVEEVTLAAFAVLCVKCLLIAACSVTIVFLLVMAAGAATRVMRAS